MPPVSITAVPDGKLHAPYFLQWSIAIEHQFGQSASVRAQYVGTRAINLPYQEQVNGYQTVCSGCFAPFPYGQPIDPRFGAVDQLNTGANSNYNGLQLTGEKRLSHGLQVHVNYTWSHCLDTVSNGGFLSFSSAGILSPLPGELGRQYGNCDYDVRHNFNGTYVYELPFKTNHSRLAALIEGWQVSGTVFWHSGLPFSVLSAPYSANGNGILQGSGPQFASVVPGVPLYSHQSIPGVTQPGTIQWLNPNAFVSTVNPSTGACNGGDSAATCQFGDLGRNSLRGPDFTWSDLYITKRFRLNEQGFAASGGAVFQRLQSSELRAAVRGGGHSRTAGNANGIRGHQFHHVATHRIARGRIRRRQLAAHDRTAYADRVLGGVERIGRQARAGRLGTLYFEIYNDRFLSAANHHGLDRHIRSGIHFLMGHERRNVNEIARVRFDDVFQMLTPTESGTSTDDVQNRFEFAMMMRGRTSRGLNADRTRPELARARAGMRDCGGAGHPRGLRRVAVQLPGANHANTMLFPIRHRTFPLEHFKPLLIAAARVDIICRRRG